jgi:hypothetical protein
MGNQACPRWLIRKKAGLSELGDLERPVAILKGRPVVGAA